MMAGESPLIRKALIHIFYGIRYSLIFRSKDGAVFIFFIKTAECCELREDNG